MAKFLDKHGLSTYESSIKERLNEKQDVLVSGDTIKTVNNQSLLGSGNISISSGVTSYNDLTDKPIYDASYIADAVGSTITNAQYEEFKNAFFSGIIIVVYGAVAALGTRDSGGVQYKTLSMNNANLVATLIVSPTNNNHTVTMEQSELAQTTDIPTATSDLTNDSGFITSSYHDNTKQDTLVSGTNIKTINSQSIVGSGNVDFYGTELPIGTEVDYDGSTVPSGWVEIDDYSTSEVNTGKKWIDGKPIYRKVLTGTTTTVDTAINIPHGISNYEYIMIDNKSFVKSTSGSNTFILPINCPPNTSSDYNKRPVRAYVSNNNISIYIGGYNGYSSYDYAIILEYTKTTD